MLYLLESAHKLVGLMKEKPEIMFTGSKLPEFDRSSLALRLTTFFI